ncbi:hypothetical protein GGI07_004708 [Coemansia sp. Benny D115]|nr:hypothetical protein GGI07_004708 [Coemansia sp. Benny D115]
MTAGLDSQLRYVLTVVQQPKRARALGFGDRDRRPVDPCPIVQLHILNCDDTENSQLLWESSFVVHVTLFDDTGTSEYAMATLTSGSPKLSAYMTSTQNEDIYEQMVLGSLASSAHHVRGLDDKRGCFFCFPDIRVRYPGRFRLRFTLIKLHTAEAESSEPISVLKHAFSDPFIVYTAKDFPGVDESTALSKKLNLQGVGIPIRNKGRLKNEEDDDNCSGTGNND